jgi:hypothetical protein
MDQKDCLGATAPADGFRCPSLHVAQASASQDQGSYKNFYAEFIRLQAYFTIHIFLLATELSSRVSNYHQTKNLVSNYHLTKSLTHLKWHRGTIFGHALLASRSDNQELANRAGRW